MAVKNRKRNQEMQRVGFPFAIMLMLIAGAGLLLLYVWMDSCGQALGARIKQLELQRDTLAKAYAQELSKWERMKAPENIEKALARNRLVMIAPATRDVVRLAPTAETARNLGPFAHAVPSHNRLTAND